MNIETIKEFVEWAEGFPFVEVYDEAWLIDDEEVCWHLCPDLEFNYIADITGGVLRKDGLVLVNIDYVCGKTITMVFLESQEIK